FFRERGGKIYASASYAEFEVGALPTHPAPPGTAPTPPEPQTEPKVIRAERSPAVETPASPQAAPVPAPEIPAEPTTPPGPAGSPVEFATPQFVTASPVWMSHWVTVVLGICATAAVMAVGYQTRGFWLSKFGGEAGRMTQPTGSPVAQTVGLNTI